VWQPELKPGSHSRDSGRCHKSQRAGYCQGGGVISGYQDADTRIWLLLGFGELAGAVALPWARAELDEFWGQLRGIGLGPGESLGPERPWFLFGTAEFTNWAALEKPLALVGGIAPEKIWHPGEIAGQPLVEGRVVIGPQKPFFLV